MSAIRNCARVLLVLAITACWAQTQSAQVVDDRLQAPEGPSSVQRAGASSRVADPSRRSPKNTPHTGVAHPPAALVEEPKPVAVAPPPPPTLAQQPPSAPQVTYRDGLLTVTANNSTLGDILNMVRSKTGASIEYPATLSQERVAAVVGPAPAPQVLATLLNGTRFDYILLGMSGRPDLLQRAIITPRDASGAVAVAAGPLSQARAASPAPAGDEEPDMAPDETAEQPEEVPQPQPQPVQPQPGVQTAPVQQFPQQPFPQQQVPQQQAPQGEQTQPVQPQQPKTPEQLLQELQRMQQQQQQQQQQQPQQ